MYVYLNYDTLSFILVNGVKPACWLMLYIDSFESFKENATSFAKKREKFHFLVLLLMLSPQHHAFKCCICSSSSTVFSSKSATATLRMHVINNVRLTFFVFIAIEGLSESLIDNIY